MGAGLLTAGMIVERRRRKGVSARSFSPVSPRDGKTFM